MMDECIPKLGTLHRKDREKRAALPGLSVVYFYDLTTRCEIPIELALMTMMVSAVSRRCKTWHASNKLC